MAAEGQQHPIGIYLWVWLALFVVSALSYYVDWAGFQGANAFAIKPGIIMGYERRSEERRVGKECRSRWSPYH